MTDPLFGDLAAEKAIQLAFTEAMRRGLLAPDGCRGPFTNGQAVDLIKTAIQAITTVATAEHGCETPDGNKVIETIAALGALAVRNRPVEAPAAPVDAAKAEAVTS